MENKSEQLRSLRFCLELLLDLEERKRAIWKKELETLPEGRLHLVPRERQVYFQNVIQGSSHGISQDLALIYELARKQYLLLLEEERRLEILWIYQASEQEKEAWGLSRRKTKKVSQPGGFRALVDEKLSDIEQLLDGYAKAGLDILRITCSKKQYHWMKAEYRRNPVHPEQRIYETYSGVKVRSKSEQRIGNALEIRGIPYRYEPEYSFEISWMEGVNGGSFGSKGRRYKNYYPDFVILTTTGELLVWEHLGMIHEEGYRIHNMEKLAAYRQSGFCDDEHLILTFEQDMIKTETLGQIIRRRILPYL